MPLYLRSNADKGEAALSADLRLRSQADKTAEAQHYFETVLVSGPTRMSVTDAVTGHYADALTVSAVMRAIVDDGVTGHYVEVLAIRSPALVAADDVLKEYLRETLTIRSRLSVTIAEVYDRLPLELADVLTVSAAMSVTAPETLYSRSYTYWSWELETVEGAGAL